MQSIANSPEVVIASQIALSLGKSIAQVTAFFSPVPGLAPAAEVLCTIITLCQNVAQNRSAIAQLRDRCHSLLSSLKECITTTNQSMTNATNSVYACLYSIENKMRRWKQLSRLQHFSQQERIRHEIEACHGEISDCLNRFQLASHNEIHEWQMEFARNMKQDHAEIMEYMSEIQNSQTLFANAQEEQTEMLRQVMAMMQKALGENRHVADRMHNGLSSNLYQLQLQTGELLPNFHLNSGEVSRIGQFPVSGTAAMDIYEGLYLQREKVAIKIVRAVNSDEQSLRRFNREAKIWAEIWNRDRGKHILPFYGFCQNDGPFPYMVSPWQQNGNALGYVKKHDLNINHRALIRGIVLGVQVLHTMEPPVVHGDIKAANIVIDARGNPLLADFGLSRIVEDITGIPFTQSRGVSDSYRWFAPEVCVGQGVLSLQSDIYGTGMTMLELLTHQQPYSNIKHTTEVVIRSSSGHHPPRPSDPRVIARGLDDDMWNLMTDCWNKTPSLRPTIQEVLERLNA